jgi:hypothetical protein
MNYHLADSSLYDLTYSKGNNRRGLNVFTLSELRGVSGRTKRGEFITGTIQDPLFTLTPDERIQIMKSCAYVQAVVSSRMNRIASLEWDIVSKEKLEDKKYYRMKHLKEMFDEHDNLADLNDLTLRYRAKLMLQQELPGLKDDLSNFDSSVRRWKKNIKLGNQDSIQEIKDWIAQPNLEDEFDDFVKKYVESLMVHGATGIYKEIVNDRLENLYILPGGTVYPLRSLNVGSYVAYAQIVSGYMPAIYFQDEMGFVNYLPSAARSYGYVPLDALVNKVAEELLFEQAAAERADGTKEPEKLLVMGKQLSPFGTDLTGDLDLPLPKEEQARIQEIVNTAIKGAIRVISGYGTPQIVDISKADTFQAQSDRQDKLLRDIALIYGMTNMEINLTGSEFTSGRETSESQAEIEEGKGTRPVIKKFESFINKNALPYRFGTKFEFQYKKGMTDYEQAELDAMLTQTGTWTKNEIREARGNDAIMEEGNDSLQQQQPQAPDGSQLNPINMKAI